MDAAALEAFRYGVRRLEMEPALGIEPRTDGLQNRCSTAELSWLKSIENKAFYAVIFTGYLSCCILDLYMVCSFCYEVQHTIVHQAQRGLGLGQNPLSKSHPLQTQWNIFWACPGQWQVNSSRTAADSWPRMTFA